MRAIVVIQARMGSSRLPGKMMLPLDGIPVIGHEILRATNVKGISSEEVVVTTSDTPQDDILEYTAREFGASVFRGSEADVLGRIAGALREHEADMGVRLSGDNPLVSPSLLTMLKEHVGSDKVAYATTKGNHTFPIGHNADAFTTELFNHAAEEADSAYHREHVGQYLKDHLEELNSVNIRAEEVFNEDYISKIPNFSKLRLTLDEADDYRLLARVYSELEYDTILDTRRAIDHIVQEDLRVLNSHVEQRVW